jgi:hypothetical protein
MGTNQTLDKSPESGVVRLPAWRVAQIKTGKWGTAQNVIYAEKQLLDDLIAISGITSLYEKGFPLPHDLFATLFNHVRAWVINSTVIQDNEGAGVPRMSPEALQEFWAEINILNAD